MTLQQLVYFQQVAADLNITKAANKLFISQPSLSIALKKLETEMGVELLQKQGHSLILTPKGKILLEYADKILSLVHNLHAELKPSFPDSKEEKLRIGYISPLSKKYIPNLLLKLQKIYKEKPVEINASLMNTHQIAASLEAKEIDIGLCCKIENDFRLTQIPLFEQPLILVCSLKHELAQKYTQKQPASISLSELADYDFISYSPEAQISSLLAGFFQREHFTPHIKYTMDSEKEILQLVKNNLGIAFIAMTDDLDPSEFFYLPLQNGKVSRFIYLTYHSDREKEGLTESVIQSILRETPYPAT